jgi:hypothetical protein
MRDDHSPTTGTKNGCKKQLQHQKMITNKPRGRVSNRRRLKIADLTSKKTCENSTKIFAVSTHGMTTPLWHLLQWVHLPKQTKKQEKN